MVHLQPAVSHQGLCLLYLRFISISCSDHLRARVMQWRGTSAEGGCLVRSKNPGLDELDCVWFSLRVRWFEVRGCGFTWRTRILERISFPSHLLVFTHTEYEERHLTGFCFCFPNLLWTETMRRGKNGELDLQNSFHLYFFYTCHSLVLVNATSPWLCSK